MIVLTGLACYIAGVITGLILADEEVETDEFSILEEEGENENA